jgi:peptide/nickel transport system substrate-binding protein
MRLLIAACVASLAGMLLPEPSAAQKSADTIRIAMNFPIKRLSPYYQPDLEAGMFFRLLEEPLVRYDEREGKFLPALAKSWKRVDERTLEFELQDGIKFHSGNAFTADDAVYMMNWRTDPKLRVPGATRFAWVEGIEKIGPMSVRIRAKEPTATDMMVLSYNFFIEDSLIHGKLQDKSEYGLKPIGTGPIKLEKLDQNVTVVAFNENRHHEHVAFTRLIGVTIPDAQTQSAHILAGTVDAIQPQTEDEMSSYGQRPELKVVSKEQFALLWLGLDTRNRGGRPELQDERIRRAIFMAIDRKGIADNFVPGESRVIDALCFEAMLACSTNKRPPAYDPAGARTLLAEAGYPNGFDLELVTRGLSRAAGIAITGQLRAVGIRATIKHLTWTAYRDYREEGKIQAIAIDSPVGSMPDASNVVQQQFGTPSRDFAADDDIQAWMAAAVGTHDLAKRKEFYAKIHDRIYEQSYLLPIATWPSTWVVNKDIEIRPAVWNHATILVRDFAWKK